MNIIAAQQFEGDLYIKASDHHRVVRAKVAAEREACAKICDEWHQACCKFETQKRTHHYIMGKGAAQCAHSIRARGVAEQEPVKRTVMYRPADLEALGLTHEDVVNLIKEQS